MVIEVTEATLDYYNTNILDGKVCKKLELSKL